MADDRKGGVHMGEGSRRSRILAFLILAFLFRFFFGLYCPPVTIEEDEVQTYVIGLKAYTTHTWPYFGPDMQGANVDKGQMPGALEGLLIALPLEIWPAPESPYLFMDLLTFFAFSLLAWYCSKRLPRLSPWFVFTWIYIAPWDLHFSTTMMNQSYGIVGSILFFIGFLESIPATASGFLSNRWANGLMGFGLFWVMQLHLSWVMLVPLLLVSFILQCGSGTWKTALVFGSLGALPMLALLAPTFIHYGFSVVRDLHGNASNFNGGNTLGFFTILARFLSFASFELPRFIGAHTADRLQYLFSDPWIALPGLFLWGVGILQPLVLLALWFRREHSKPEWGAVKLAALGSFLILYFEFWFSRKPPASYGYYEALPMAMIYSFYCWDLLWDKTFWRKFAAVFLAAGLFFQAGYALKNAADHTSVYVRYRDKMGLAIKAKDFRLLAQRRDYALY